MYGKHKTISGPVAGYSAVLVLLMLLTAFSCGKTAPPSSSSKTYYFVIDTSGSMAGREKIMDRVKHAFPRLMENVKQGDKVRLITFDDDTKEIGTYTIQSEEDRQEIIKIVTDLKADGLYTDLTAMVRSLSENLAAASGENPVVIILSDGLNDPHPKKKTNGVKLEDIRDPSRSAEEKFIYYVNLGAISDPEIREKLGMKAGHVKVIEARTDAGKNDSGNKESEVKAETLQKAKTMQDPGKAGAAYKPASGEAGKTVQEAKQEESDSPFKADLGIGEITEEIQKQHIVINESRIPFYIISGVITAIVLTLFLVILLMWLGTRASSAFRGRILYYEAASKPYNGRTYNLSKVKGGSLTIGKKGSVNIKIRDLGTDGVLRLKSGVSGGKHYLRPAWGSASKVRTADNASAVSKIPMGGKFRIGNYIFEYGDAKE